MRYCVVLILIVLSLAGCGKPPNSSEGERITHASETLPVPEPLPFAFDRDNITKVTIYRGDGKLVTELTDSEKLNMLAGILDNARSFSKLYPFDLRFKFVIESQDDIKREFSLTGHGHVFVDETAKIAYELDKQKFEEFIAELKIPAIFEPGIAFVFPAGVDADEQAVIAIALKTMEAMVNKDKESFRATLESPEKNYLGFLTAEEKTFGFVSNMKKIAPSTSRVTPLPHEKIRKANGRLPTLINKSNRLLRECGLRRPIGRLFVVGVSPTCIHDYFSGGCNFMCSQSV